MAQSLFFFQIRTLEALHHILINKRAKQLQVAKVTILPDQNLLEATCQPQT
jgi:hypothetical protein